MFIIRGCNVNKDVRADLFSNSLEAEDLIHLFKIHGLPLKLLKVMFPHGYRQSLLTTYGVTISTTQTDLFP